MRMFAPSLVADAYWWTVMAAGLSWICAFGIFIVVYTPTLLRRRIDGRRDRRSASVRLRLRGWPPHRRREYVEHERG
jgi:hypothetical protein